MLRQHFILRACILKKLLEVVSIRMQTHLGPA
jgi:hypothetical protein